MLRAAIVHNFIDWSWDVIQCTGEKTACQRCILVLSELYDEVYLVGYPHNMHGSGCYSHIGKNLYHISSDKMPSSGVDLLFYCEDYKDQSGEKRIFIDQAQTDNIFTYHWAVPALGLPDCFKAIIFWIGNYKTVEAENISYEGKGRLIPFEYHPIYIPVIDNPIKPRWCFIGRGRGLNPYSRIHLLLEAILESPHHVKRHEIAMLRSEKLLNDHNDFETKQELDYLHLLQNLSLKIPNLIIVPGVGQQLFGKILSEAELIADLTNGYTSLSIQEALVYGAQVIKTQPYLNKNGMNINWIDDNDVCSIPSEIEPDDKLLKKWLIDILCNLPKRSEDNIRKYQIIHGLENSCLQMRNILDKYNIPHL